MFERFKAFLKDLGGRHPDNETRPEEAAIAAVALALSVIRADGIVDSSEKKALESVIREHYHLDHRGFDEVLATATAEGLAATDSYRFASYLRRHLDEPAKIEFVGILWSLVEADGKHNELEDHMVWRIAEMIGVSGRDRTRRQHMGES